MSGALGGTGAEQRMQSPGQGGSGQKTTGRRKSESCAKGEGVAVEVTAHPLSTCRSNPSWAELGPAGRKMSRMGNPEMKQEVNNPGTRSTERNTHF